MTQGVKMIKIRECPMALLVLVKGKTLINLVEVVLAEDETMKQMMGTTIIVKNGNLILVKDLAVLAIGKAEVTEEGVLVIGKTEMKEEGVLVHPEMKNVVVVVVEVVVVEGVGEEEALVVDEEEGNMTDTVEVIERKCCSQIVVIIFNQKTFQGTLYIN